MLCVAVEVLVDGLAALSFGPDAFMPKRTSASYTQVRDAHVAAAMVASRLSDKGGNVSLAVFDKEQESKRAQLAEGARGGKGGRGGEGGKAKGRKGGRKAKPAKGERLKGGSIGGPLERKKKKGKQKRTKKARGAGTEAEAEAEEAEQAGFGRNQTARRPAERCGVCGERPTSRGVDRNCCHKGGSWYGRCGRRGNAEEAHTFREGFKACRNDSTPLKLGE